jgi:hypothetical protein
LFGGVFNKDTTATDNGKNHTSFEQNAPELGNIDSTETDVLPRWDPTEIFPSWSPDDSAEVSYKESREEDTPATTAAKSRLKSTQPCDELPYVISSYQYSSVPSSAIRLLRISPGQHNDPIVCALKPILVERIKASVLAFQALSYSWDNDKVAESHIALYNLIATTGMEPGDEEPEIAEEKPIHYKFMVRNNLFQALKRIRQPKKHLWLWVDAICIDQADEADKSRQIPYMPEIYSSAWNVIVWLGEEERHPGDIQRAICLIPKLLNLRTLDSILHADTTSHEDASSWASFGHLLQRSWFSRRWGKLKKLTLKVVLTAFSSRPGSRLCSKAIDSNPRSPSELD